VGDHHDGLAVVVRGVAEEVEQSSAMSGVEIPGGLVGEHHVGPGHQGASNCDALLLTAGELGGLVTEPVGKAQGGDQPGEPFRVGLAAGEGERQADVLGSGEGGDEVVRLEHETDPVATQQGPLPLGEVGDVDLARTGRGVSGQHHAAGVDGVQAGQRVHQGRLAGPGRAHDGGERAAVQVDRGAVEGADGGGTVAVGLDQIVGTDGHRG
jgi:hypothetical protein